MNSVNMDHTVKSSGSGQKEAAAPARNLCCTYPHGDVVLIPQILTLMAVFASCMAFPVLNFYGQALNFMCVEVIRNGVRSSDCGPLMMNRQEYWSPTEKEGWAGAIQAAAIFGIFAVMCGFMATALLFTSICFRLKPRRVLGILILQGAAAIFCILTLIAGAADVCKLLGNDDGSCSTDKAHVASGAGFMIFSFLIYIAAWVMTLIFFLEIRHEHNSKKAAKTHRFNSPGVPMGGGGGVSITKTVNADGTTRIEREFVGQQGQLVKEVTIEETETEGALPLPQTISTDI